MKEVTLALGGGGIKGIAHLGIIRELTKKNYTIRAIAGTSAGGIAGSVVALGHDIEEIIETVNNIDQKKIFSHILEKNPSLLGLSGLIDILSPYLGGKSFDDLKIPFACTAVDLTSSKEIILNSGNVLDAILATIAVPGIFPPKVINGHRLVDGGILDPVPVALARYLYPSAPVVAICLSPDTKVDMCQPAFHLPAAAPIPIPEMIIEQFSKLRISQAVNIFTQSIEITSNKLADLRLEMEQPDILIRPNLDHISIFDTVDPEELVKIGEESFIEVEKDLEKEYSLLNQISRLGKNPKFPGEALQ